MRYIILFSAAAIISCSSPQIKTSEVQEKELHVENLIISTDTTEAEEEEPDYRQEYISSYEQELKTDTTITNNNTNYKYIFKHYCTWDSGLVVPAKYNYDIKTDFRTHNFQSELTVLLNGKLTFQKVITKADFYPLLNSPLKDYANLLYPKVEFKKDSIHVFYSISIPVTDVGIGVAIKFDNAGNFTIEE